MKKGFEYFIIAVFVLLFAISCKRETDKVNFDFGYSYYPSDSGDYVIYKVDSVIYNYFNLPVLRRFSSQYLKEIITDSFTDNLGRNAKIIMRYTTDSLNHPWTFDRAWYFVKNATNVEQVEDNIRYIKLTFPVLNGNTWKGNKYNELKHYPFGDLRYATSDFDWTYLITNINEHYANGSISSDSTISILQVDDSTNVQRVYSVEKYSKNIGLVYKELWRLDAQLKGNQNFIDSARSGFIMRQYAIQFGKD